MRSRIRSTRLVVAAFLFAAAVPSSAQDQTVGLFLNDERAFEGYTLMVTATNTPPSVTYLLDNGGREVNSWASDLQPGAMGYLLENGHLLSARKIASVPFRWIFAAGTGGVLEERDWNGNLVWEFEYSSNTVQAHHDIEPLPNGNVLLIAWEYKTQSEAIAAGRNPLMLQSQLWPLHIIEVQPTPPSGGVIVWEWHAWDHLIQDLDPTKDNFGVVADHPELIDLNYPTDASAADWIHANGLDYNPELDQIVVSSRSFSEFWVIDHSTTTAEAAGHSGGNSEMGGDILYRWGNPQAYRRGTVDDQTLFHQHDAQWIPPGYPGAGNILVFDNGSGRPGDDYSQVEEIVPPVDEFGNYTIDPGEPFGPAGPLWYYVATPTTDFFSAFISGAERMPNGNTLICEGNSGHIFEVTGAGEKVWDYVNPVSGDGVVSQGDPISSNDVFKVRRYAPEYPGFAGRDMTAGDPIEVFDPPYPVAAGSLVAARATPSGDQIEVQWDASSCPTSGYDLLFGDLSAVALGDLQGAECGIGIGGSYLWTGVPTGSLFFVVVGTDGSGVYESSWGGDTNGGERGGTRASGFCGATTKVVTSSCP